MVSGQSAFLPSSPSNYKLPAERLDKETGVSELRNVVSPRWGCGTEGWRSRISLTFMSRPDGAPSLTLDASRPSATDRSRSGISSTSELFVANALSQIWTRQAFESVRCLRMVRRRSVWHLCWRFLLASCLCAFLISVLTLTCRVRTLTDAVCNACIANCYSANSHT